MMGTNSLAIFKNGSRTYFYSSLFFPKSKRSEVATLYRFVRIIDDIVDQQKPDRKLFDKYFNYCCSQNKNNTRLRIDFIDEYLELATHYNFEKTWIRAFFDSMRMDLDEPIHKNFAQTQKYIYGSAEVIGLMMAKLMELPDEALKTAQLLGSAMQYANFIRDYAEDQQLGRQYLQVANAEEFVANFSRFEKQFLDWQMQAERGYKYLPKRYLVPIKTAADMYKWTISEIRKNPQIVMHKKIKPTVWRILSSGLINVLNVYLIGKKI